MNKKDQQTQPFFANMEKPQTIKNGQTHTHQLLKQQEKQELAVQRQITWYTDSIKSHKINDRIST